MRQRTDGEVTGSQRRLDATDPAAAAASNRVATGSVDSANFGADHNGADRNGADHNGAVRSSSRRTTRVLKTIGRNVVAIAAFAIPSVVLWWHVWSGHPSATLTCPCGDPAQQVWFTAWPAYAITHLHSLVFSHAVNVPYGANLLSNTAGTLAAVVVAPITWAWGPIAATNVLLTLGPALSAWACYVALRPIVRWRPGAVVAGLVFGYSASMVDSISYGHVSMSILVVPPLLFSLLHEILIRQQHSARRDGLCLAALLVVQFLISPEVLVICALVTVIGLVAVLLVGWRQIRVRSWHALPAIAIGLGVAAVALAYPIWFGLAGPQTVSGVLFAIAPLAGVPLAGVLTPGNYNEFANSLVLVSGYMGRLGPSTDYFGWGALYSVIAAVALGWRRLLTWLLLFLALVTLLLSLGGYAVEGPAWLTHVWLPWRDIVKLPVFKEIVATQIISFVPLFVGFLLAVGLDALFTRPLAPSTTAPIPSTTSSGATEVSPASTAPAIEAHAADSIDGEPGPEERNGGGGRRSTRTWFDAHRVVVTALATVAVGAATLIPLFITYDMPFTVTKVQLPTYYSTVAPKLPASTVLLTIPFAVSGSAQPMLWQAVDGFHFRLAGAALKTPNATGGPVQQGLPGSARAILTNLSVSGGGPQATGTVAELTAVRAALVSWQVERVVITGTSIDPVYASGFFTEALGTAPVFESGAWVWTLRPGWTSVKPAYGATLKFCREAASAPAVSMQPQYMSSCVLSSASHT